jgi:hypothetical protein
MAMKNGRCKFHGGKSTGPKTPEGRARVALAATRDGRYTKRAVSERRIIRALLRDSRDTVSDILAGIKAGKDDSGVMGRGNHESN